MEMHEIRYFLAASRTLNFHRAAEMTHVTQPALTRAIQKLEAELGGRLFHRERNHVRLTDLGLLMRGHLQQIIQCSDVARDAARNFLRPEKRGLALGVMPTINSLRFVGFLRDFVLREPGIAVTVIEGTPSRLARLLFEGEVDIALMAQPAPFGEPLLAEPIYFERFCLAFCAGHRLEKRDELHLGDVEGEPYLDRVNCEFGKHIENLCAERNIHLSIAGRSEREDWIIAMIAAGLGISFLPEYAAAQPGVRLRPVTGPEIVRTVSLVTFTGAGLSPAVTAFSQAVRDYDWAARSEHEVAQPRI